MESLNFKINKKFLLFFLPLFLALILTITLFFNYTSLNKQDNILNTTASKIESCNKNFTDIINSNGLNTDKAIDTLSNNTIKLQSIKTSLNNAEVTEKNEVLKNTLSENIDYNISLNNLCLNLLKNPQDKDFSTKYTNYSDTYNKLLDNYSSLNSSGIKIDFSDNAKNFFDYLSQYFSTLISLTRDNDIKVSQKSNYVSSLNDCIDKFDKIDEDLKPALDKIREDNRDLNVLLKDVRDKKAALNEIKNTSYCIPIPENGNECFNLLQDTINFYELYITSLEHSIVIEKTSNYEDNKKNIEENYENSFSKFADFKESLKNLRIELDKFNNK